MITAFVEIWTAVGTFITSQFPNLVSLFWTAGEGATAGSLTFVGTMAVIMAGVALILLVFNLIRSFFVMRG